MAQTYTLEEAAQRLGLTQEDFKRRIKDEWKSVRSFRDGPTLRFRSTDIDELARMLGEASDPGLQLGAVDAGSDLEASDASDHFSFTDDDLAPAASPARSHPSQPSASPNANADVPLLLDSDEDFAFDFNDPPPSSVRVEQTGSDSNVKVDPPTGSGRHRSPKSGAGLHPTDEIQLDLSGPPSAVIRPSGASPKSGGGGTLGNLSGPKSQKMPSPLSGKIPGPTPGAVNSEDGSSEFELSLDGDSDSFELKLSSESDEVDIGLDLSPPPGADRGGLSGINLGRPADSGISLERPSGMLGKPSPPASRSDEEDLDFDLSMDSGEEDISGPKTSHRIASPGSGDVRSSNLNADSEFELTLDDNSGVVDALSEDLMGPRTTSGDASQGDIFETDFEIPTLEDESESEVVTVDEETPLAEGDGSDYDFAISDDDAPVYDESASEVVAVDDEMELVEEDGVVVDEDAIGYDDLDSGFSASQALRGVSPEDDDIVVESDGPVRTVEAPPAPWGPLPALVLLPCLLLVFIGSLMSFELLRSMWGYHQPSPPGNVIVRGMADAMGFQTKD
ncbi:MAG: hypothetical protein LC104_20370 [Bacteroidales bacterium]|nr:hypothetical protein [Bacteroidales bacterium]